VRNLKSTSEKSNQASRRAAFTLLELMLSLALTATLLTVVYSALELHWRFSTLGHVEVERAQIARAILTKMSADIRSTMYAPPVDEYVPDDTSEDNTTDNTGTSGSEADEFLVEPMIEVTDPAEAYSGSSIGVFGDAVSLVLHINRPYRANATSEEEMLNPESQSNQKSVSYFLAGGEGSLATMVAGQFQTEQDYDDGIDGLARMSGDRFTLTLADQQGDMIQLASQTKLLAEEINSLSFEYHDGVEWLTEWDSDVQGRVPNAIGITIGFREPDHPEGSILYHQPSESTDTYRLVVPLVVSSPFEGLVF
jgi:type II secretory pathway pseudopilin PulG